MLTLAQIQEQAYATACEKGWHDRPLRSAVIGDILGSPPSGSPVFVTTGGELPGRFCGSPTDYGETLRCPGRLFGRPVSNGQEIWTIHHDRVLAKHALIHTELTEAAECLEQGDLAQREINGKLEGYVVEIADAIIRVCDTTAALSLTLQVPDSWLVSDSAMNVDMAAHWLAKARRYIDRATEAARVDDWNRYTNVLSVAVVILADTCAGLKLDLGAAIEAKMRYNKTRPHRHGGKQA